VSGTPREPVDEPALLPGTVIRCAQGEQDVVGLEAPDGVGEGAERSLVADRAATSRWARAPRRGRGGSVAAALAELGDLPGDVAVLEEQERDRLPVVGQEDVDEALARLAARGTYDPTQDELADELGASYNVRRVT